MISRNLTEVRKRINSACAKIGTNPNEIAFIVVTKGRSSEEIKEAFEAGAVEIGENKVQEALSKYNELMLSVSYLQGIKWHMVGHLQTNKAREAVKIFDLIQSVDSLRLADEINKQAAKINKCQDILVEIKTSPEAAKFGLKPDETIEVIRKISELKNITIKGLMTIAPIVDSLEKTRPFFRALRELKEKINKLTNNQLTILSMGMSDDFEVAIEEGSNMVRLGRAVFEG